jgi:HlyD family secretion protein
MSETTELEMGKTMVTSAEGLGVRAAPPPRNGKGGKSKMKIILAVVAAVVLIGLVIFAISWSKRGTVSVQTSKVGRTDIASVVTASGQIKPPPEDLANVNANSMGKIVELLVHEGDAVKKGQLLMRTEDIQQAADVDAMAAGLKTEEADVSGAESNVQSAAAAMKTAQADYEQAQAKLKQTKLDYDRGDQLFKDSLIAKQVFDQRRSDYEVALAAGQSAEARVAQSKAQYQQTLFNRDMARARVSQNRAQLVRATDVRNKTVYTAPFDGTITSLPVHQGENVVPGIQNSAGSVLFQIADLSVITAEVMVDETDVINIKLKQAAEVTIDAIPNKTFKGKVTEIGQSAVSRTTGQTATTSSTANEEAKDFKVVVTLDSPPPGLRPGLSTTAKITTATGQNVVTVPIQALTIRTRKELDEAEKAAQGKGKALAAEKAPPAKETKDKEKEELQGLFVVDKTHMAKFVPVETGIMGSTDVEITKGVQPGDEIVTGSYQVLRTLKTNTKVQVEKAPPAGANPGSSTSS